MNPLLQKYEELYGKKEPPKMPRIEDYEGEDTFADELKKPKPRKITTYDPDDLKASFQQVAEKIKNGEAQVVSMSMEMGHKYINTTGGRITFEVSLDDY